MEGKEILKHFTYKIYIFFFLLFVVFQTLVGLILSLPDMLYFVVVLILINIAKLLLIKNFKLLTVYISIIFPSSLYFSECILKLAEVHKQNKTPTELLTILIKDCYELIVTFLVLLSLLFIISIAIVVTNIKKIFDNRSSYLFYLSISIYVLSISIKNFNDELFFILITAYLFYLYLKILTKTGFDLTCFVSLSYFIFLTASNISYLYKIHIPLINSGMIIDPLQFILTEILTLLLIIKDKRIVYYGQQPVQTS